MKLIYIAGPYRGKTKNVDNIFYAVKEIIALLNKKYLLEQKAKDAEIHS